ncbi:SPOR domain-containing protein [Carboxylicivirga sp. RSCT41]|uniref:HU domain-containing protein n=1 Tax=Carboxylicivirga agarovorans TaxID=3417570 RepID=UPI003D347056
MTTVEQHISGLLFTHECVIIPALGALVSTNVSARFDADKNMFIPPSKEIGFNRSLSHNDGLLISTLSQKNDISYGKAKVMVEEFVDSLMACVDKGESAHISKVGSLKKDALGNLQFVAEAGESYLTDSYGLSSFHFKPAVTLHKPVAENRQVRRLLQPVGLKQIAASVAMIIGLFAISQSLDNPMRTDTSEANMMSFVIPADTEVTNNDTKVVTSNEVEKAIEKESSEMAAVEEQAPLVKDSYFLIAGSFKTQNQANRFLNIVHEMGEDQAFVLSSPNNRYRVAINGYANKAEAISELNVYRQMEDFKTVWVLTQK